MKKIFSVLFAVLFCVSVLATFSFAEGEDGEVMSVTATANSAEGTDMEYWSRFAGQNLSINVYNWGQYISDGSDGSIDVNREFEELTGIHVNYTTYDSNEVMYTKLKTGGSTYDVIIPSDYMIARLIDEDMLEKLDLDNIPNYANVDEAYKNTDYDPQNEYSVPYTWGTVGVIYNTKYVTETPDSWDILWDSKYSGKILMFDNPRDAFAIAEYKLGYSINSSDEKEFEACAEILSKQKPLVQNYVMDQIYEAMINEEAYVAPYYAGDFLQMQVDNEDLAFAFPKEGFNIFIDAACVPKGAQNKEAAEMYINFLCEPEISGQNLDYLGYSTPISAAKEYMDEETVASEIAYPSDETLSRATSFTFLDTATTQNMDKLWNGVRTGDTAGDTGSSMTGVIIGIIVVAVAAVVFLVLRAVQKKKRIAARGE